MQTSPAPQGGSTEPFGASNPELSERSRSSSSPSQTARAPLSCMRPWIGEAGEALMGTSASWPGFGRLSRLYSGWALRIAGLEASSRSTSRSRRTGGLWKLTTFQLYFQKRLGVPIRSILFATHSDVQLHVILAQCCPSKHSTLRFVCNGKFWLVYKMPFPWAPDARHCHS